MQADILWARLQGTEKQRAQLAETETWLWAPQTQTAIADAIDWIQAHTSGIPHNTISWETQMARLRSSFIWQGTE